MTSLKRRRTPLPLQTLVSLGLEDLLRRASDACKDPSCQELSALTADQSAKAASILTFVKQIPASAVEEILHRVLDYQEGTENLRKASPMDIYILVHPSCKRLVYTRDSDGHRKRHPLPNVHKALFEALHRCKFLETLTVTGMDDLATTPDYNDLAHSSDCREHYMGVLEDSLYCFSYLTSLNLGTLANNAICKAVAETCSQLKELRMCGPCKVTDLGIRYLAGRIPTVGERPVASDDNNNNNTAGSTNHGMRTDSGCLLLQIVSLVDVEKVSLHTLTLLLLHLPHLRVLDHNHLHEALWLLHKTGTAPETLNLKLTGYNGRGPAQCRPDYLDVIRQLCPKLENLHLCTTFESTVISLAKFSRLLNLSIYRVSTMEHFELPLMAFGKHLMRLELKNCANFQSGMALHIRKYCPVLRVLVLEIESLSNQGGLGEALDGQSQQQLQNIWTLQHQVQDLQTRLDQLQVKMLDAMEAHGSMSKLEELQLRNLSMGSLLILLPFAPRLRRLSMKYSNSRSSLANGGDGAPNLTDALFLKIFGRNSFEELETLTIWCKTLSIRTAQWFVRNCPKLTTLKSLSFWNITDEEQVQLWREGRAREPIPVEVDL